MTSTLAPVSILTSGVGLGVYIPALLVDRQLHKLGLAADVEVLENYYTPVRQKGHLAFRDAHHTNFALAQMAHRMVRDVQECLDPERVGLLIQSWAKEQRDHFIVWSGFWLPVIEEYRRQASNRHLYVDHCRIDAEISASFKIYPQLQYSGRAIWLWNWAERSLVHRLSAKTGRPLPFGSRDHRLVVHGGGWGIGTYREKAVELRSAGYALDIVIHDGSEACRNSRDRYFMLEPDWRPWNKASDGTQEFPPMGELRASHTIAYERNSDYHPFYDVIRGSMAIVSKPGGCTLIDSLNSATPVILLEPYGYAERSNALMWEHLGFGMPYEKWQQTGYDTAVLEKLHLNILAASGIGIDYPQMYVAELERRLQS
jgi:hypothetical protein